MKPIHALQLACIICVQPLLGSSLSAQGVIVNRGRRSAIDQYWYAPVDAAVSQIYAYSDLLRSAAVESRARASKIRAEAAQLEIRNSVDRVRSYWKRKEVHRAAMLQQHISQIDRVKYSNSQRWTRLSSLPELTSPSGIHEGSSLNFLLNRLDGTILTYDFHYRSRQADDELREKLALDPAIVRDLRFRQLRKGGQYFEFNAELGEALDLSWWPFALRQTVFDKERGALESARNRLASEARKTGQIGNAEILKLNDGMRALWEAFHSHYTRDVIFADIPKSYDHWHNAEVFLKTLDAQVHRLESTGNAAAFDGRLRFDMEKDGGDLLSLLTFMVQNGLEFAPAKSGSEASYNTIFRMMRDVYALVSEDDAALKPEKTREDTVTPGVLEIR